MNRNEHGALSVVFPVQPSDQKAFKEFARWVQEHPGARLWTGQSMGISGFQAAAYVAGGGVHVPFGFGVNLMTLMHPVELAIQARALAALSGHEVMAGIGTGGPAFVRAMTGREETRPAARTREYLDVARRTLSGEHFVHDGEFYDVEGMFAPLASPPVSFGAGVLRPRMAHTAGGAADFMVSWLAPPAWLRETLVPALERGAVEAARARPRVVAYLHAALRRPGRVAEDLVAAGNSAHLSAAHYADALRQAGVTVEPNGSVSPRTLIENGVFGFGSAAEVHASIDQLWSSGADEVALNLSGVYLTEGASAVLKDLDEIFEYVHGARSVEPWRLSGGAAHARW